MELEIAIFAFLIGAVVGVIVMYRDCDKEIKRAAATGGRIVSGGILYKVTKG